MWETKDNSGFSSSLLATKEAAAPNTELEVGKMWLLLLLAFSHLKKSILISSRRRWRLFLFKMLLLGWGGAVDRNQVWGFAERQKSLLLLRRLECVKCPYWKKSEEATTPSGLPVFSWRLLLLHGSGLGVSRLSSLVRILLDHCLQVFSPLGRPCSLFLSGSRL